MKKRQTDESKSGVLHSLRHDRVYRRKFVLTLSVSWSYVILGWSVLQIGTALPDLQLLVNVDLETAAWIFTVWSIGFVVGSLVSGRLYDRCNRLVIMLVSSVAMSVCCFFIPYSTGIAMLLVIRLLSGFFAGGIDTGANTIVPTLWDSQDGQSFMQAMYLAYTLGGIFSPLATKPFMALSYTSTDHDSTTLRAGGYFNNRSENVVVDGTGDNNTVGTATVDSVVRNTTDNMIDYTVIPDVVARMEYGDIANASTKIQGSEAHDLGDFRIHYAFIITGCVVLSSAIPYIIMTLVGNFDTRVKKESVPDNPEVENLKSDHATTNDGHVTEASATYAIKGTNLWLILGFVAGINFVYSAIEDALGDFLTTYCLFHLNWTKSDSVLLMSLYWVTSCSGGFAGIFVIKRFGPARLLTLAFCVWNVSFIIAVIGNVTLMSTLTWVGFLGAGSAMVLVIPAILSWTCENVCEISGKVSSIMMISSGVGIAANPKFIGYMMETYSYGNFVYVLTCESFLCSLLFIGAIATFSCCRNDTDVSRDIHVKA